PARAGVGHHTPTVAGASAAGERARFRTGRATVWMEDAAKRRGSCAGRPPRCPRRYRPGQTVACRSGRELLLPLRLAVLAPLLVDRRRGPALRLLRRDAALLVRLLDVLVLALALPAGACGHVSPPCRSLLVVPVRPGGKPHASPAVRPLLPWRAPGHARWGG